jgi:hypothetical protein
MTTQEYKRRLLELEAQLSARTTREGEAHAIKSSTRLAMPPTRVWPTKR